jgi:hypothetical protein
LALELREIGVVGMRRIVCAIIGLLVLSTGCASPGRSGLPDETIDFTVDAENDSETGADNLAGGDLYINGIKIDDLAYLHKNELVLMLGKDYLLTYGWADEADREGYEYEKHGITFFFNDNELVESMRCGERADVEGVRLGMTFAEIQNILGLGEIRDYGNNAFFRFSLTYKYEKFALWFGAHEENGDSIEFHIRFNLWR